jgi:hypothetical protein
MRDILRLLIIHLNNIIFTSSTVQRLAVLIRSYINYKEGRTQRKVSGFLNRWEISLLIE